MRTSVALALLGFFTSSSYGQRRFLDDLSMSVRCDVLR